MQYLGNACIFKHYPLFIWNKNLTVHPVFLIAKYCNPINKAVVVRVSNFKEPFSSVFLKPFRKKKTPWYSAWWLENGINTVLWNREMVLFEVEGNTFNDILKFCSMLNYLKTSYTASGIDILYIMAYTR